MKKLIQLLYDLEDELFDEWEEDRNFPLWDLIDDVNDLIYEWEEQ